MNDKQTEFDFEQYQEPRRTYTQPRAEYFRRAFQMPVESGYTQPLNSKAFDLQEVEQREEAFTFTPKPMSKELFAALAGEPHTTSSAPILSQDSAERKQTPMWSGWLQYFPLAHAAAARHSFRMNEKHNPGEPMHWARDKSKDHEDCAQRHLVDVHHFNEETQEYEEACSLFWRAGAILQLLEEKRLGR